MLLGGALDNECERSAYESNKVVYCMFSRSNEQWHEVAAVFPLRRVYYLLYKGITARSKHLLMCVLYFFDILAHFRPFRRELWCLVAMSNEI